MGKIATVRSHMKKLFDMERHIEKKKIIIRQGKKGEQELQLHQGPLDVPPTSE